MPSPDLTVEAQALINFYLYTATSALIRAVRLREDGSKNLEEYVRGTHPIDFAQLPGEFALDGHKDNIDFPLSPAYINLREMPNWLNVVTGATMSRVALTCKEEPMLVVPIPNAATDFTDAFAKISKLPCRHLLEKIEGPQAEFRLAEGRSEGDDEAVLLSDDVVTSSSTKKKAAKVLQEHGFRVVGFLVVVDREQGGVEDLNRLGFSVDSVMKVRPMLRYIYRETPILQGRFRETYAYFSPKK